MIRRQFTGNKIALKLKMLAQTFINHQEIDDDSQCEFRISNLR